MTTILHKLPTDLLQYVLNPYLDWYIDIPNLQQLLEDKIIFKIEPHNITVVETEYIHTLNEEDKEEKEYNSYNKGDNDENSETEDNEDNENEEDTVVINSIRTYRNNNLIKVE